MGTNLNDLTGDARHMKGYVFREILFVQSKVLFSFNPYRFLSFLCKTKLSCKFFFGVARMYFLLLSCFDDRRFFPQMYLGFDKVLMPKRKCGVMRISKCFQHSVQWHMFIAKKVCFLSGSICSVLAQSI